MLALKWIIVIITLAIVLISILVSYGFRLCSNSLDLPGFTRCVQGCGTLGYKLTRWHAGFVVMLELILSSIIT